MLIPMVGILCTTLVLLVWYPKKIKMGRLAVLYIIDSARTLSFLDCHLISLNEGDIKFLSKSKLV
jgi:hypothetical protein